MSMRYLFFSSLLSIVWVTSAAASPASEEARACVQASTRGQTERDEGRLLAAREDLLACARDGCPSVVRGHCEAWLAELEQRIPSVVVRVLDASGIDIVDADVRVDGSSVSLDGRPVLLDPGFHTVVVTAQGRLPVHRKFLLAEREKARLLDIELREAASERAAATESTPRDARFAVPTGAWVLGGAGLVALGTFVALGTRAASELEHLEQTCDPLCTRAERRHGENLALAADVFLAIGAVSAISAGAWSLGKWLRRRRSARAFEHASATLRIRDRGAFGAIGVRY